MGPAFAPSRPNGWPPSGYVYGTTVPLTPGRAGQTMRVPGGSYRVWLYGSSGRPIKAVIDRRTVGSFKQTNTPGGWVPVGHVTLPAGRHRLEIVRPGGSLAPGDAYQGRIGPLALEPTTPETIVRVRPRDASRLCGQELDWVERVRLPQRPS